ncbi:MAG TPA: hypothetical protein VG917_04505 [Patescibacteria group bacterium]|nr:hypothetical protein [Patescibacteria group bacterium]
MKERFGNIEEEEGIYLRVAEVDSQDEVSWAGDGILAAINGASVNVAGLPYGEKFLLIVSARQKPRETVDKAITNALAISGRIMQFDDDLISRVEGIYSDQALKKYSNGQMDPIRRN